MTSPDNGYVSSRSMSLCGGQSNIKWLIVPPQGRLLELVLTWDGRHCSSPPGWHPFFAAFCSRLLVPSASFQIPVTGYCRRFSSGCRLCVDLFDLLVWMLPWHSKVPTSSYNGYNESGMRNFENSPSEPMFRIVSEAKFHSKCTAAVGVNIYMLSRERGGIIMVVFHSTQEHSNINVKTEDKQWNNYGGIEWLPSSLQLQFSEG